MIGVNVGFMNFVPKKDLTYVSSSINKIPIYLDYRYYFNDFYVEPQAGAAFNMGGTTTDAYGNTSTSISAKGIGFGFAVGAGYTLNQQFDFSLRYESYVRDGMTGFLALRVALNHNSLRR